ncbi:MAG: hypothetical protein HY367_04385 [Candidatus Aenigmarchaeota archaeon]|nr:hypothetical protein [Candidatus Aenigmarchaeota archaeon]
MDKVKAKNPGWKRGLSIDKAKYDVMRSAILDCLKKRQCTHTEMANYTGKKLKGKFPGSIEWYMQVVKRDLEGKGVIGRVPKTSPQLCEIRKR